MLSVPGGTRLLKEDRRVRSSLGRSFDSLTRPAPAAVGGIYSMQLSDEQCENFRRDHFLVVRDVLPSTAIEAMRAELSDNVAAAASV